MGKVVLDVKSGRGTTFDQKTLLLCFAGGRDGVNGDKMLFVCIQYRCGGQGSRVGRGDVWLLTFVVSGRFECCVCSRGDGNLKNLQM